MIFNFGKSDTIISKELMKCFLSLFNSRSERICLFHKEVNERKDTYVKLKGSKCFASADDMTRASNLFQDNQPIYNRLYFLKKFNNNNVLFFIDFFEKKIFYIDPKQSDRTIVPENLQDFFDQTKEEISNVFLSAHLDVNEIDVEIYPHQYYPYNESNLYSDLYIILILYFLETDVPIWFTSKMLKETMKINFAYWLLNRSLPF